VGASDLGGFALVTPEAAKRARELVRSAGRIVVLTGAGVSAESGVPTFRGQGGLWKTHRPEDLATPEAFARDPRLVWEWYAWRRGLVSGCDPNQAHRALARLALDEPGRTTIVTQNVDGLHHRAARALAEEWGTVSPEPAYPLEVHGAIHRNRCSGCSRLEEHPPVVDASGPDTLPRCPTCGALYRPDVVWFGEPLDPAVIGAAFEAAREADLCLVVGTSALVHPAASVPEVTLQSGGAVVEVNLEPTPLTPRATCSVPGRAGELLADIVS
jgi:NAD-dependent deacetylase